ncbi:hypothetical protein [Rhodococcoides kroppenstedtii]|uniref:hypothetical protein n=1 Tax=Rhodococcoides kroppenstedtii TaxID=293050 RepID=UPI00364129BD
MPPIAVDELDATLSRRDAADRVARIASAARHNRVPDRGQADALHLLRRARVVGDAILEQELIAGAGAFGWPDVLTELPSTASPESGR